MKAIKFEHVNKVLKADGCHDLPVYFDGRNIIFCWKLSLKERIKLLFTGKLWHLILSNRSCIQPVSLDVNYPFVKNPNETTQKPQKRLFYDGTGQFPNSESNACRANCVVTKWNVPDSNGGRVTEIQLDNGRFVSMPHEQMLSFLHFVEDDSNDK